MWSWHEIKMTVHLLKRKQMPLRSLIKRKKKNTLFNELKDEEKKRIIGINITLDTTNITGTKGTRQESAQNCTHMKKHQNFQLCSSTTFSHSEILQLRCNQFQLVMIQQLKISITVQPTAVQLPVTSGKEDVPVRHIVMREWMARGSQDRGEEQGEAVRLRKCFK